MVMDDNDELHFCWDNRKAEGNLDKHRVSFESATYVFDDPMRLERSDSFAEGEYRTIVIGKAGNALVAVVYSEMENSLYRIISARRATAAERNDYEQDSFHP